MPAVATVAVLTVVRVLPFLIAFSVIGVALRFVFRRASRLKILGAAFLVTAIGASGLQFVVLEAWPDPLFAVMSANDTEFAPRYSAYGFWCVRDGMTMDDVMRRVGAPLERYAIPGRPDEQGWRWTRSRHDNNYHVRVVVFRHGKVAEKHSEFYVD